VIFIQKYRVEELVVSLREGLENHFTEKSYGGYLLKTEEHPGAEHIHKTIQKIP
jgi:hypothetical protein